MNSEMLKALLNLSSSTGYQLVEDDFVYTYAELQRLNLARFDSELWFRTDAGNIFVELLLRWANEYLDGI